MKLHVLFVVNKSWILKLVSLDNFSPWCETDFHEIKVDEKMALHQLTGKRSRRNCSPHGKISTATCRLLGAIMALYRAGSYLLDPLQRLGSHLLGPAAYSICYETLLGVACLGPVWETCVAGFLSGVTWRERMSPFVINGKSYDVCKIACVWNRAVFKQVS